jgi:2-succinyl-6-hydroxy-2,4-cyclohexadiene-1-carboxylate synthase
VNVLQAGGLAVLDSGGDGPGVLWVHGYTLDSTVWEPLWSSLPGWRHLGVDLPGHGRSRPLAPDERLSTLGAEIAAIARNWGIGHLVGLSFGSMVALQAAIAAPSQFLTLTLAAPAIAGGPVDAAAEVRYGQLGELYREFGPGPHMRQLWMSSPPHIFTGARAHPRLWEQLELLVGRHGWRELASGAMRSLTTDVQAPEDLRRITADTLVLIGEDDMPAFRASAALLQRDLRRASVVEVPAAGHLCLLEAPVVCAARLHEHFATARDTVSRPSS